jgi:hypothetical protein
MPDTKNAAAEKLAALAAVLSPAEIEKLLGRVVNKVAKDNEDRLKHDPDFKAKQERAVTTARDLASLKQALKPGKDDDGNECPSRLQRQITGAEERIVKWTRQIHEGTEATNEGGHMHESARLAKADFEAYVQKTLGGDGAEAYLASLEKPEADANADADEDPVMGVDPDADENTNEPDEE